MQPACPQVQSMSGVFSMAAHSVLQYLPDFVRHEQMGCAHFSAFVASIFPPSYNSTLGDTLADVEPRNRGRLSNKEHMAILILICTQQGLSRILGPNCLMWNNVLAGQWESNTLAASS